VSRLMLIVLSSTWLTACGNTSGSPQSARPVTSPPIPAKVADKPDGIYKGFAFTAVSASPICPTAQWGTVEIGDQTLYFALTPQTIFIAPIQPDGTVRMVLPDGTLAGRLMDGRLLFSVKNRVCETTYDLQRVI